MERIGIFGGTFHPPHVGHIQAAKAAIEVLGLTYLLLIPERIAPKVLLPDGSPTPEQRLRMLSIAADCPKMEVLDVQLRQESTGDDLLVVSQLRSVYPDAELILLMGSDRFLMFRTEPEKLPQNTSLGVLYRGEKGEKTAVQTHKTELEAAGWTVCLVENEAVNISSTHMRRLLAFRCAGDLLPEGVLDYIREQHLYNTRAPWKNLPMEELEQVVIGLLNPNRVAHVLGCRDTAVDLAKHWGADETDAARAGILHDITKAIDGPLQLTLCAAYGRVLSDFSKRYPKTLHAMTGSMVAERIFGENAAVVSAIEWHTTGRANMTLLEKIIYLADYIEPNRTIPGVEELRRLAFSDIDAALKRGLEMTLEHLNRQGSEVSPESREALAWLNG